jgi:hypothetical protein
MHYTKLDTFNIDIDLFQYKGIPGKSYPGITKGMYLKYYQFSDITKYINHFPKFTNILPDSILLAEISGTGVLGPHIDHGPKCVLNWYETSNDSVTYFYTKNENAKGIVFPGETEPNIFYPNEVSVIDEFVANNNEAYLLDVSKIHSVYSPHDGVRRFVSLGFSRNTYIEVLESVRLYREGN